MKTPANGRKSPAQIEHEREEQEIARRRAEREEEIAEREEIRQVTEAKRRDEVEKALERKRIEHEATKQHVAEITRANPYELPAPGEWTAQDFVDEDDDPPEAVIEGLHYRGSNTLLVAEFKAGKTTMEVNLAKAIVDGAPFLGRFKTNMPWGKVALFNYEMDRRQFRQWLRDANIENLDRIVPLNLRGWRLPFWEEETLNRLAEWLLKNEVGFVIVDPAARAWRGLVEQEGDNVQLAEFFGALDELKRLADVSNLLISAHKPRAKEDRARGGGEIEAWPDGNWYLNKDKDGLRSLRAEGRDVLLDEVAIEFAEESRSLQAVGSMEEVKVEQDVLTVVATVKAHGEYPSQNTLKDDIKGISNTRKERAIREAVGRGLITETNIGKGNAYDVPKR